MNLAQPLQIEFVDQNMIFNISDDVLSTMPETHPHYMARFRQLSDEVMGCILKQQAVRCHLTPGTIFYINHLGAVVNSFNSLAVYHYIRMRPQKGPLNLHDNANRLEVLHEARDFYHASRFSNGQLNLNDENFKLNSFIPNSRVGYRVDHLVHELDVQGIHLQQFVADFQPVGKEIL